MLIIANNWPKIKWKFAPKSIFYLYDVLSKKPDDEEHSSLFVVDDICILHLRCNAGLTEDFEDFFSSLLKSLKCYYWALFEALESNPDILEAQKN